MRAASAGAAAPLPERSVPAKPAAIAASTRPAPAPRRVGVRKPLKAVVVLAMVGGLVATVAIPAFASFTPTANAQTLQQASADDAQKIVVASDATAAALDRDGYSATTPEELAKSKAEAAALARAKAAASTASFKFRNLNMVAPGSGAVRWPLAHVDHVGDGFMARGGEHMGVDLLDPAGTPIFAAAAGVVRVSTESYYAYGVAIVIDSVINGQRVSTTYAHMTYGSRQVVAGQTVAAGQLIGAVGSTGRSTANHLHFETAINGTRVDPLAWLQANAGPIP